MFNFDKIDTQRLVVSGLGAVAMTLASLTVAAAPVNAATLNAPATLADWQAQVERQLDRIEDISNIAPDTQTREVTLATAFTADGDYAGARVIQSSGNRAVDAHAVQVAGNVKFPALPAGYRGKPQTVTVKLYFGKDAVLAAATAGRKSQNGARFAKGADAGNQVAAK